MKPRLLIVREKKVFIEDLGREVRVVKHKEYIVRNPAQDFSSTHGTVSAKDLKAKDGSAIKTGTGKDCIILTPSFNDLFRRLRKLPQTIPLKDLGAIAAETGIGKNSVVLDAGTGSGAVSCFFAHLCKKVISYDINEEFQAVAKENAKVLGLKNIAFKQGSAYDGFKEKDIDLIIFDLPEPWQGLDSAVTALKIDGSLVSYSPSVPQVQDFCNAVRARSDFLMGKTVEIIERTWEVEERRVRPKSISIGHSGFMTFCRRIM